MNTSLQQTETFLILKTNIMKRLITISLLIAAFIAGVFSYDVYDDYRFSKKVEAVNARVKYLQVEEGYTEEAARVIATTEAGMRPIDTEYLSLIED